MKNIHKKREKFVKKYLHELSVKTGKSEEDLLASGLSCDDFKNDVFIEHEDYSTCKYKYAFFVEKKNWYAIFTEHCDYHEFKKEWINSISEVKDVELGNKKNIRIKWAGPNTPYIAFDRIDIRVYTNKRELLELKKVLNHFLEFYEGDFQSHNIDYEDNEDEIV